MQNPILMKSIVIVFVISNLIATSIAAKVTVGFTKSRFSAQPGKSVEIAVEIKSGDLQPNETARVECDSASKNNTATGGKDSINPVSLKFTQQGRLITSKMTFREPTVEGEQYRIELVPIPNDNTDKTDSDTRTHDIFVSFLSGVAMITIEDVPVNKGVSNFLGLLTPLITIAPLIALGIMVYKCKNR